MIGTFLPCTSEIAISQLSDGASIILLFEYLGLVLTYSIYEKRSFKFAIFTDLFAFNQAQTMFAHRELEKQGEL